MYSRRNDALLFSAAVRVAYLEPLFRKSLSFIVRQLLVNKNHLKMSFFVRRYGCFEEQWTMDDGFYISLLRLHQWCLEFNRHRGTHCQAVCARHGRCWIWSMNFFLGSMYLKDTLRWIKRNRKWNHSMDAHIAPHRDWKGLVQDGSKSCHNCETFRRYLSLMQQTLHSPWLMKQPQLGFG
jgi:hypothetical protein